MFLLSLQCDVNITNMPQPAHRQVSDRKSPLDVGVWQVKTDHEPQWAPCVEILTLFASIFRRKVQSHSMQPYKRSVVIIHIFRCPGYHIGILVCKLDNRNHEGPSMV